jgi:DNA processing protein
MNVDQKRKAAATWSLLCEPGDSMAGMLRRILGTEEALFEIRRAKSAKDVLPLLPTDHFSSPAFANTLNDSLECWKRRLDKVNVDKSLDTFTNLGGFLIEPSSEVWPTGLDDLGDCAPAAIWGLGNKSVLENQQTLSVVGARLASNYGLGVTQDLVKTAVSKGFVIVSGGALGIDAKAHTSALEVSGKTVAIMAGGLDRLYPPRNMDLFEEIKQTGLLISEMPPGTAPARWRFLQRNRLIAALGKATVVVEAGFKSGSINTAGHANELERPVGAIPGPINSTRSAGCHRLIKERRAELISTPADLFELLNIRNLETERMSFGLSGYQWRALDGLAHFEQGVETVATNSGMSLNEARFTLESLQKLGLVMRTSNGWLKVSNTL